MGSKTESQESCIESIVTHYRCGRLRSVRVCWSKLLICLKPTLGRVYKRKKKKKKKKYSTFFIKGVIGVVRREHKVTV